MLNTIGRRFVVSSLLLSGCPGEDAAEPANIETSRGSSESSGTTQVPLPTTDPDPPIVTSTDGTESTGTSGSDDTSGSSTGSSGSPVCGDGVIEGDEECDDKFINNTLEGACLPACFKARCGDGVVHAGVEECDLGDGLNEFKYGGCIPETCKWGPRCGDGQLDAPDEVCDPGEPNGQDDETVGCDLDCRFEGRIVFLSSASYTGNLGGLAGADSLCRDLAATFDVSRADRYVAWLSDGKSSPLNRIKHGPEFDDTPYVLRSGVQVAANFKALIDDGPWPGIDLTETYENVVDARVWTNTAIDGSVFSDEHHCDGWGSESFEKGARVGRNRLPLDSPDLQPWQQFGHWTSWTAQLCDSKRRLYCFEN